MHMARDKYMAHVLHCEPSAGPVCKTIEVACKVETLLLSAQFAVCVLTVCMLIVCTLSLLCLLCLFSVFVPTVSLLCLFIGMMCCLGGVEMDDDSE